MNEALAVRAHRFMELADEALADARAAKDRGSGRNCLNRAYYAAFYAASALLTARDLHSSKHHGVLSLFDREFVLKDLMSREHGRALHRLFELRSDADYEIFGDFSSDEIDWAVVAAAALLSDARERLDEILKEK